MPDLGRDSITAADIPMQGIACVMGYGDGPFTWTPADWALVPPEVVPLSIVVSADDAGDILDVENGDATPADAPRWYDAFRRPARRLPTIYCSRDTIEAVRTALGSQRPFDWWASTLDGTTDVPGATAVQYCGGRGSNDPCNTTGHYDESVILDPGWIGDPTPPVPPPPPAIARGGTMSTMARAQHPNGTRVDYLRIRPDHQVEWKGCDPGWDLGHSTWSILPGMTDAAGVAADWSSAAVPVLGVTVETTDGAMWINGVPSDTWSWGAWMEDPDPGRALVPATTADLAAGGTVPVHDHEVSLSGTTGPPA